MPSSPAARDQVLIHFYRAVVAHGDAWRQRMDATTNWAAATSAVMITFVFGSVDSPHFVLLVALAFDLVFLLMESRRYQVYDLWRRRFRLLNRHLIVPALVGEAGDGDAEAARQLEAEGLRVLAGDLSHSVPHMGIVAALSYRVRRNYGYLLLVVVFAWLLKLEMHPQPVTSFSAMVARAAIGPLSGAVVFGGVMTLSALLLVLALTGPSERMKDWAEIPSPILRMRSLRGRPRRSGEQSPSGIVAPGAGE